MTTVELDGLRITYERLGEGPPLVLLHSYVGDGPKTLILASAYAGWVGSLPPEVTKQRLQQALVLADLSSEQLVGALLPRCSQQRRPRIQSKRSARP